MEGLAAVINDICNGVIVDESLRCRLLASRLVPITKPSGGIRPIAIGEVICKLAILYSMSLCFSSDVYEKLFPEIQERVGY